MSRIRNAMMIMTVSLCSIGMGIYVTKAISKNVNNNKSDNQIEDFSNYYSYLDKIELDNVINVISSADRIIDISDVESLKNFHTNVFIGTVDSIDGCSTTISSGNFSSMPNTYGKITVLRNLKGQIDNNSITYARPGGIISIVEYEKNAPSELIENRRKHRIQNGQENLNLDNTYLNYIEENDIKFEVGKTYLFFATFNSETNIYQIDGVQYGTREIVELVTNKSVFRLLPDESKLQIKNNDTGKNESLEDFINTYFN